MMSSPPMGCTWISFEEASQIHEAQIEIHGGLSGVRDLSAVHAALNRPINKASYENATGCELAAAYAFGLAKNHGFVDGNKRTAWVTCRLFMVRSKLSFRSETLETIKTVEGVASGSISEEELAEWLSARIFTS